MRVMRSATRALTLALCGLILCSCAKEPKGKTKKDADADKSAGDNPVVVINTSMGKITMELFADKSPITVKNFLKYVDQGFYDGTIFHRVMGAENFERDFMIQGGGFLPGPKEKEETGAPIENEAGNGLSNERGTLAMARTPDPNSARAQFFINVADNARLDRSPRDAGYAVFGKVIKGMDVVDKIKAVETHTTQAEAIGPGGQRVKTDFENVPVKDVIIKSIRRVSDKKQDKSESKEKKKGKSESTDKKK
jgi:cyclophilin family peptidyl-prolyl cis-trans isomerase